MIFPLSHALYAASSTCMSRTGRTKSSSHADTKQGGQMPKTYRFKAILAGSAAVSALATAAYGANFNIPAGPLDAALDAYTAQSGVPVIAATDQLRNTRTKGIAGDLPPDAALSRLLKGTGFVPSRDQSGAIN